MPDEKKEQPKIKETLVLAEIPKQEARIIEDKEGNVYDVITMEEAVTEILNTLRLIKKSLV